ncbi:MAG: hypothetical protein O0W93_00355, partial [Methanocorpusculum sp.]|nr:hypothetical protein [Methanocorpusculum sp.]
FGCVDRGTIQNLDLNRVNISVQANQVFHVGGLVGYAYGSKISSCSVNDGYIKGVSTTGNCFVGGLGGIIGGRGVDRAVVGSYAAVAVMGITEKGTEMCCGGLIGKRGGVVWNC